MCTFGGQIQIFANAICLPKHASIIVLRSTHPVKNEAHISMFGTFGMLRRLRSIRGKPVCRFFYKRLWMCPRALCLYWF